MHFRHELIRLRGFQRALPIESVLVRRCLPSLLLQLLSPLGLCYGKTRVFSGEFIDDKDQPHGLGLLLLDPKLQFNTGNLPTHQLWTELGLGPLNSLLVGQVWILYWELSIGFVAFYKFICEKGQICPSTFKYYSHLTSVILWEQKYPCRYNS